MENVQQRVEGKDAFKLTGKCRGLSAKLIFLKSVLFRISILIMRIFVNWKKTLRRKYKLSDPNTKSLLVSSVTGWNVFSRYNINHIL